MVSRTNRAERCRAFIRQWPRNETGGAAGADITGGRAVCDGACERCQCQHEQAVVARISPHDEAESCECSPSCTSAQSCDHVAPWCTVLRHGVPCCNMHIAQPYATATRRTRARQWPAVLSAPRRRAGASASHRTRRASSAAPASRARRWCREAGNGAAGTSASKRHGFVAAVCHFEARAELSPGQSRCRCRRGEPSPAGGVDVTALGEPSSGADVAGVS